MCQKANKKAKRQEKESEFVPHSCLLYCKHKEDM